MALAPIVGWGVRQNGACEYDGPTKHTRTEYEYAMTYSHMQFESYSHDNGQATRETAGHLCD